MTARQYRKKPVTIEARHYDGTETVAYEIIGWIDGHSTDGHRLDAVYDCYDDSLVIKTLEGNMTASPGDYIIRGVAGEFYPCKPDIFAATYEAADQ